MNNKDNKNVNESSKKEEDSSVNNYSLTDEFTRKNLELLKPKINLVDSDKDNNLDMFCYTRCNDEDSNLIKQCRGVVFNGEKIVLKAFPYNKELNNQEDDKIKETIENMDDWEFYESHEGSLIRVFNFNKKWYVSTHRKLDAFKSKWSSKTSFGEFFKNGLIFEEKTNETFSDAIEKGNDDDIISRFQKILDENKQYMFLITNNEDNRIVCQAPENTIIYHVGTFIDGKLDLSSDIPLKSPKKLEFKNHEEMCYYIQKMDYKTHQGVIAFNKNTNTQVKLLNIDYQHLFNARGNEPSIKYRYLQIRMFPEVVRNLEYLYPYMLRIFDDYEHYLFEIAKIIYEAYVRRYIHKEYVTLPKEEFNVMKECHNQYINNKSKNKISLERVIIIMNNQNATSLNKMIRRYKLDLYKKEKNKNIE